MLKLKSVEFSLTERVFFDYACKIIKKLSKELDGQTLYNPDTGEVITADELPRTLGILSGLANGEKWYMMDE